jgi:hypothetical protein
VVTTLKAELKLEKDSTGTPSIGSAFFLSNRQTQTLPVVSVSNHIPLLSSISMIAPSPDWFTGFTNFDTRDKAAGTWYKKFIIETYPWDAGTEQGGQFAQTNNPQDPPAAIRVIDASTAPNSGAFLNPSGTAVNPVARWQCTLLTDPETRPPTKAPVKVTATVSVSVATSPDKNCIAARLSCNKNSDCCSNFCVDVSGDKVCHRSAPTPSYSTLSIFTYLDTVKGGSTSSITGYKKETAPTQPPRARDEVTGHSLRRNIFQP